MVIDSYGEIGIGLGSELSQLLALFTLDGLDHFIKEQLRVEFYVRYMDDGVLIVRTKDEARRCLALIKQWLESKGLKAHPKKSRIHRLIEPTTFLGWRYFLKKDGKILKRPKRDKVKNTIRHLRNMKRVHLPQEDIKFSLDCSIAALKWGDAHKEIMKLLKFYKEEIKNVGS